MLTCAFKTHVKDSINDKYYFYKILIFNFQKNKLTQFPKQNYISQFLRMILIKSFTMESAISTVKTSNNRQKTKLKM